MRLLCCACGREKIEGVWRVPEAVAERGEGLDSHGYCSECAALELRKDAFARKLKAASERPIQ
jgi:hypothetical protein